VRALAAGESVGRPHVARALIERGYVRNVQEAFDRFIGNDGPAYVPRLRLAPAETIGVILEAGGIPVIAHPAYSGQMAVSRIPEFAQDGLRGIEVFYPGHTDQDVAMLQALCLKHDLLATGGSDFHGPGMGEGSYLGSTFVPPECLEQLHRENRRRTIA
jgi:predicted metal-dependent phosphoesterase TrpH